MRNRGNNNTPEPERMLEDIFKTTRRKLEHPFEYTFYICNFLHLKQVHVEQPSSHIWFVDALVKSRQRDGHQEWEWVNLMIYNIHNISYINFVISI